jgi:hypothetical protein
MAATPVFLCRKHLAMRRTHYVAATAIALVQGTAVSASEGLGGPTLVQMQEIVVPIVDGARAYGRLRIKLVLLARDAAAIPPIEARMPELRETALIAAAEFAKFYASPFAPIDARRLAHDISSALTAQDKEHVISRILLVGVLAERT